MGLLILLVIIVAFTAAALRQEAGPALTGAVFFLPWFYSLVMTLILASVHNRRARRAFIRVSPREIIVGGQAEAVYSEGDTVVSVGRILQLPGILVRCRVLLVTKDGRRISHDFNPNDSEDSGKLPHFFRVEKRGAYFSAYDEFAVFDVFGFFRFTYLLSAGSNARLLASPNAAQESLAVHARAGESNQQPEFSFQRTDNLIDHRPYIPGDDPRRINWKLYGHGGGLFVREGEREPPPHSNIVIMADCEYDPSLYDRDEARLGVDVLCENALAAAQACLESGMDVLITYTSDAADRSDIPLLLPAKQASSLAWPAALPLSAALELPAAPEDYSILILALPRSASDTSLDRFLKNTAARRAGKNNVVDLIFFCDNNKERYTAAETCCTLYRQRPGITARIMRN
jgi:uncharacterized protein (DUF58 family)